MIAINRMTSKARHGTIDAHYTPASIAMKLLGRVDRLPAGSIADFAAGGGELLIQATQRWPGREIVACDISPRVVSAMSDNWPNWSVGRCDFFSLRSRAASPVLRAAKGNVALCLANPPFSYRGGKRWRVDTGNEASVLCGPAVAFLLNAIEYLKPCGQLLAIVPANALRSEKDEAAINRLSRVGVFEVLDVYPRGTFPSCTSRTVSISFLRTGELIQPVTSKAEDRAIRLEVELTRGSTPMHYVEPLRKRYLPVVHTSNLCDHSVQRLIYGVAAASRLTKGPAVLLPRVGRPDSSKIALYTAAQPIVLSDCVFAINCDSTADALHLLNVLLGNWSTLAETYHGTCAPYLTVRDLVGSLYKLGVRVRANGSLKENGEPLAPSEPAAMNDARDQSFNSVGVP